VDIKGNGVPTGQTVVAIEEGDTGFLFSGCGTWSILEATPTPIPTATLTATLVPTAPSTPTPAPTLTPTATPVPPTKLALMEDRIRQGVTILTADNTSGFELPASIWDFRFGGLGYGAVQEVKLSVSYPSLPNHLCDGLLYEVSRIEKTIWIAFFFTMGSTESGWFARFGGDGPFTKSYRYLNLPPFNCHKLFPDAGGKTSYFYVPVFLGSEESYPYLARGLYTVITNYGFLGETYTHILEVP
jgi:hypothetical protein